MPSEPSGPAQSERGVYFFLNNYLCETSDDTGAFKPSDIFEIPDQSTTVSFLRSFDSGEKTADGFPDGAGGSLNPFNSANGGLVTADNNSPADIVTPELDDVAFNALGILSKGALIDARRQDFVDFSSEAVFHVVGGRGPSGAARKANARCYTQGDFSAIQPHHVLTLWSSIEPLDGRTTTGASGESGGGVVDTESDFRAWPHSSTVLAAPVVRLLVERNVQRLSSACRMNAGGDLKSRDQARFLKHWRDVDTIRLESKLAFTALPYLTPVLLNRLQYKGRMLSQHDSAPEGAADGGDRPTQSPASSFSCYRGVPVLKDTKYLRRRGEKVLFIPAEDEALPLRAKLHPRNADAVLKDLPTQMSVGNTFLEPPDASRLTLRSRAWHLFKMYYAFLGVEVQHPRTGRVDGRTDARYTLDPNAEFSAADCVQGKWKQREAERNASLSEQATCPPVAPAQSLKEIPQAWNYLLVHQQHLLMDRLRRVEAYLHKLERHQAAKAPGNKRARSGSRTV